MADPGEYFDIKLNLFACKKPADIEFRIITLQSYVQPTFTPLQLAINNLIGLLHFHLGRYDDSYQAFSKVLKFDCKNLNALGNLYRVCQRLMNLTEAEEYRTRRDDVRTNPEKWTFVRAKAEHAYAHAFEVYGATHERERYHISNRIYDDCLDEADKLNLIIPKESAEWLMCKVWNFKKIFNRNFIQDCSESKNQNFYPIILKTLYRIRDLVPDDPYLTSLVWAYLGYYFWKKPESPDHGELPPRQSDMDVPDIVKTNEMGEYFNNPRYCFEKALDKEVNVEVLILYVGWLKEIKEYDQAIHRINQCIELDPSAGNYMTYSKRAELLYHKCMDRMNHGTKLDEVKEDIEKAITDFKFVSRTNPSIFVYVHLGLCFKLASDKGQDRKYKSKCLGAFQKGLDCLDGKHDSFLHFNHAKSLKYVGEDDGYISCLQRSVDCQNPKTTFVNDIRDLLTTYIKRFQHGQNKDIIEEAVYWFCNAFDKYERKSFHNMTKTLMINTDGNFFNVFFSSLCMKGDHEIKKFIVDIFRDDEVSHKSNCVDIMCNMLSCSWGITTVTPSKPVLKRSGCMRPRNRAGMEYDFFVIHSGKDRDCVLYSLLQQLENFGNFKGFIADRDFTPGKTIIANIETAINKCNKFILFITKNFINSEWCTFETQNALTDALNKKKKDSIIPIVMEGTKVPDFLVAFTHLPIDEEEINPTQIERLVKALDS